MTGILKVDTIQKNDGSTPTAADLGLNVSGGILQVENNIITSKISTSSTTFVSTGLSVSITPISATSKILVLATGNAGIANNGLDRIHFRIGGMTSTSVGDAATGYETSQTICPRSADTGWAQNPFHITLMDSPNTTSEVTYTLLWAAAQAANTIYLNSAANSDSLVGNTPTTLTVMEIAG